MPSINFFVDAPLLVKRAGKPFHLEKRLQSRKCVSHEDNVARREAFLHARRTKLTMYQEQLKIAVEEHRKKNEDRLTATRNKIENDLQTAEELRAQKLMAFKQSQSEVVAKAKSTARMNKQKQLQGAAELQDDIAAKLRVSALRRKKLAEIPRSKLLNATSWGYQEEAQVLDDAAVTIQSWYRKCKLRPITRLYKKMGMTRENLLAIGFPKMMAKLQIEPLIKTVKILLLRAKKTTGKSVSHLKNPARTFLSLYMVVLYSDETLQSSEAQEVDLKNIATASLELFETWMSSARASVARKFMDTFISYYNAFEAWKTRDTFKVVDDLVGQFMELEGLWLSVMNQVDADGEWAPAIQEQQNEISKRLASFGPSALSRLEAQRTITRDQVIQSNAPVDIFSQAMTSNEMYRVKVNNVPIEVKQDVDSSVEPEAELDSAEFGAFLSNEMLAHELVMDPNYSLKPAAKSPLETQVSEIAKKAFTDALREDINNGNYANYVFGMVVQIREVYIFNSGTA